MVVWLVAPLASFVGEGRCLIILPYLSFYLRVGWVLIHGDILARRQSLVCSIVLEPLQGANLVATIWEQEEKIRLPFHKLHSTSMLCFIVRSLDNLHLL